VGFVSPPSVTPRLLLHAAVAHLLMVGNIESAVSAMQDEGKRGEQGRNCLRQSHPNNCRGAYGAPREVDDYDIPRALNDISYHYGAAVIYLYH